MYKEDDFCDQADRLNINNLMNELENDIPWNDNIDILSDEDIDFLDKDVG